MSQPKGALDKKKRRPCTRQKALDKKHSTMRPGLGPRALDRFFFSPSSCRVLAFPQALLDDRYHLNYSSYQVAWPLNRSMIDPPNMWLLLICGCISGASADETAFLSFLFSCGSNTAAAF